MASLTLASPCITSTIFNSETSSNNGRDDSFSSYLNLIRESLAKDQTDNSGDTPTTMQISIGKTQGEDRELDIFRAEKYFSGVMDGESTNMEKSPVISSYKKEGKMMSLKSISMTESTYSEVSANSRKTLLRDHRRKLSSSSSSNGRRRRLLRVFRCSCSGKDATRVEEDMNGNKKQEFFVERSSFATKIEDALTFMTLNSQMGAARMTIQKETFGSPFIEKSVMVSTLRKSLTLLTPPLPSINGSSLFRPETGYEPSEASIDWSVTTASAGNDERKLDIHEGNRPSKSGKHSMLLGCASEKAVNVTSTENYSKKPERPLSSMSNNYEQMRSLPPLLRYHASQAVQSRHSLDFTHGGL
ncbi:uncharacterized protein LOC120260227 [Dioscorea cayenensis subsp. rotundata]|uniref:Uncharacterized protein LOC120260227 n=1 Tax=Dioscorea cayennensis subsp. rotundata TaxID=55577 RepID=A0AB40B8J9_DIOCR|nr:uncharacterized protein LOC120260227 [Dioscorea cayenensis subsp. rotundata]